MPNGMRENVFTWPNEEHIYWMFILNHLTLLPNFLLVIGTIIHLYKATRCTFPESHTYMDNL